MAFLPAAQYHHGLTARGTAPQPVCGQPTKNGTACGNRVQHGFDGCSSHNRVSV